MCINVSTEARWVHRRQGFLARWGMGALSIQKTKSEQVPVQKFCTRYEINNMLFQLNRNTKPKWCLLFILGFLAQGHWQGSASVPVKLSRTRSRGKATSELRE